MSLRDRGPYKVENLGNALRIVDKDGADVCVVGTARDDYNQELAAFIADRLNEETS